MHPVLFRVGDFAIGTYGLGIVLGIFASMWVAMHLAKKRGIRPEFFYDLVFVVLICGFLGARLLFILQNFPDFLKQPGAYIFSRQGFVYLGGFIAAVAGGIWFARRQGIPLVEMGDIVAPALAIGHGFGRIGCFFAGCCHGKACIPGQSPAWMDSLGVQYPLLTTPSGQPDFQFNYAYQEQMHLGLLEPGAAQPWPILPTQLFESAGNFLLFGLLFWFWHRRRFSGQIFVMYLFLYPVLRFTLEFFRGDESRGYIGFLSTSQFISVLMVLFGIGLFQLFRKNGVMTLPDSAKPRLVAESAEPEASAKTSISRRRRQRPARK